MCRYRTSKAELVCDHCLDVHCNNKVCLMSFQPGKTNVVTKKLRFRPNRHVHAVNNSQGETSLPDSGKDLPKSKRYKLLKKLGLR